MYVYEYHLGGLFVSEYELSLEETHCKRCGDYDWPIGYAENRREAWDLFDGDIDIDGSGGWDYEYIKSFINEHWNE